MRAITGALAVPVLAAAMLAAVTVAGTSAASASTATATAAKPVAGKAPLKDLIGQPVKHVKPPVIPKQYLGKEQAPKLPTGASSACRAAVKPGQVQCAAISRAVSASGAKAAAARDTTASAKPKSAAAAAAATVSGYSPAQLQQAYNLTTASTSGGTSGGSPEVVAVIGAYDDPNAASDLAAYRAQMGLAPCVTAAGGSLPVGSGCLVKVNEDNQTSPLPSAPTAADGDWTWAESDQIDMVTAICPNCQILLVEANSSSIADLGQGVLAAENDADFATANWYTPEFYGETADDQAYFNAPGKALVFPSGNSGNESEWPAASQYTVSVGGTTLTADASTSRGYTETAYGGSGSACTTLEPKPSWQTDTGTDGCPNRTENDVSADADPSTGVAVYDSTAFSGTSARTAGWGQGSGTGSAAAIITGAYALAGLPQPGTYPASYPYQPGSSGDFNDITSGTSNGTCEPSRQYLCNAETGYDGPTGEGTPDGTGGLAYNGGSGSTVTLPDPGTQDYTPGEQADIPLQAADSDPSQAITYTAAGLPNGMSINSATGAITGTVSDTVPATGSESAVTVTATDASGATGSVTFDIVETAPMNSGSTPASGPVTSGVSGKCLDNTNGTTTAGNPIQSYACNGETTQNWTFKPSGDPGSAGTVEFSADAGMCLAATGTTSGSAAELETCASGDDEEAWQIQSGGLLYNPVSRLCLANPANSTTNGSKLDVESCNAAAAGQQWTFPAGQILSAIGGDCLDDYQQSTANKTKADLYQCNTSVGQQWTLETNNSVQIQGVCLDMTSSSKINGGLADIYSCNGTGAQSWTLEPNGEIVNLTSGKCLDDPSNSGTWGTQIVQWDCDGQPGEIWEAT